MIYSFLLSNGFRRYDSSIRIYDEFVIVVYTVSGVLSVYVHVPSNVNKYFHNVNLLLEKRYKHLIPTPLKNSMVSNKIPLDSEITVWFLQQPLDVDAFKSKLTKVRPILSRKQPKENQIVSYIELRAPNDLEYFKVVKMSGDRYLSTTLSNVKVHAKRIIDNPSGRNTCYRTWVERNIDDINSGNLVTKFIIEKQHVSKVNKMLKEYLSNVDGTCLNYTLPDFN